MRLTLNILTTVYKFLIFLWNFSDVETLIQMTSKKKKKTELLDNFWTERMRRKLMTNICSPHSFTFAWRTFTHLSVSLRLNNNKDFKTVLKTKRLQTHLYYNSTATRLTCNTLAHCTIRYFYYLNFWIQKAIFAEHIEPVKKLISILTRCILSCCHTVSLSLSRALFKYENCTFSN